ncbi:MULTISPECIES: helix-turn-helix domain-containing protein [Streptomyces]|uniref:Helix-turn-helix domain-containing protein n=1 Tax=Streptomyces sudanensis TaxID=436397 RepID=A0ABY4TAZ4_9ACTN|nr:MULTISPECIES: helix-turn-helix transcriptional regulator [Streptomyces]URN16129.1 helix-turn-helix domain-containing protein [Streptomyces sudanensis]
MHSLPHDHTGARIKRLRLQYGLTQKALSDLSGIPYSTLTKTEQGRIAATPYVIACVARALRVEPAAVTGQPYADELRADALDVLLLPIREALDVYDLGPDPDITPRPWRLLHADADELLLDVRAGQIKKAASHVAGLIQEVTTAAHLTQTADGWRTLASTYRTAYDVATKLGYSDLAVIALSRMDWAAVHASDALVGGMYRYMRALTHLRSGQYRTGARLVQTGFQVLDQAEEGRERDAVAGQLHLGAAVLAGRAKRAHDAEQHLAEADRLADRTGEAVEVHWLAFGPTNVAVHRVSVLAELDRYDEAVRDGVQVTLPDAYPASRRSHHYADLARAQMWDGDLSGAFASLLAARKAAPQQAKYHPMVRETYHGLEAAKRALPDTFLSYGTWLGI